MRKALIVIAKEGYQDVELQGTHKGLTAADWSVTIASTESGECRGKFGGSATADIALCDVRVTDYDRIAFIGGPGARELWKNADAVRIANDAVANGIVLGAICIAPAVLAEAGVLIGKRATIWNEDGTQEEFLAARGAIYTGEPVTVDGRIVTANGPSAAEEFGKIVAGL